MEKKNLRIAGCEDKVSQNGKKYTRFKTLSIDGTMENWMSVFDVKIIASLKDALMKGKAVCVSIAVDEEKGYKNIRAYHGLAEENFNVDEKKVKIAESTKDNKFASMYVSYAKDIFVAMFEALDHPAKEVLSNSALMNEAVKLIKQAKLEFEA